MQDNEQIVSKVKVMRRGDLAKLVALAAEERAQRESVGFNSSI